jgi:hypothetical protein
LAITLLLVIAGQAAAPPYVAVQADLAVQEEMRITLLAVVTQLRHDLDDWITYTENDSATHVWTPNGWVAESVLLTTRRTQLAYWNERLVMLEGLGD